MRAGLEAVRLPADLAQILPPPVTKESTEALMKAADLVVVTGSQDNVRRAAISGTPSIGVGAGNVPVIIDESADLGFIANFATVQIDELRELDVAAKFHVWRNAYVRIHG